MKLANTDRFISIIHRILLRLETLYHRDSSWNLTECSKGALAVQIAKVLTGDVDFPCWYYLTLHCTASQGIHRGGPAVKVGEVTGVELQTVLASGAQSTVAQFLLTSWHLLQAENCINGGKLPLGFCFWGKEVSLGFFSGVSSFGQP